MSAFCVTALRPIGHSQYTALNRSAATPIAAGVMLLLTLVVGGIWISARAAVCLSAVAAGYALAMAAAVRALKGVSGDLAGYSLCVGELCGLIALAIL